ncbi:MAG: hypothetical protein CMP20_02720 [Rickettsiales bacterium]|nr:hypothetical protein [Rickettsiales bacterium]
MIASEWLTAEDVFALCFSSQHLAYVIGCDAYVMKYVKRLRQAAPHTFFDAYQTGNNQMLWIKFMGARHSKKLHAEAELTFIEACADNNVDMVVLFLRFGWKVQQLYLTDPVRICVHNSCIDVLEVLTRYCTNETHTRYNLEHNDSACTLLCEKLRLEWKYAYRTIFEQYDADTFEKLYHWFDGCELQTMMLIASLGNSVSIYDRCVLLGGSDTLVLQKNGQEKTT